MYDIILSFLTALAVTYFAIPSVIKVAKVKNLIDVPGHRAAHETPTPSLGGIAIFAGTVFAITMWTPFRYFAGLQYILCAMMIIFLIGAKDDIMPMSPLRKLGGQIAAAAILALKADVIITTLYGLLGIYELPYWLGVIFSVFVIILIINAFNLIDGINGLAASLGILISLVFGTWFFLVERVELAMVAFALTGALVAFLKYNYTPADIFMGDTGSMLIGLVCAMLANKFLESHNSYFSEVLPEKPFLAVYEMKSVPAIVFGVLIIPLFDTIRVFMTRIIRKKSPFSADKRHIHHMLLDIGLTHIQATGVLVLVNIFFIILVFSLQNIGTLLLILLVLGLATLLSTILFIQAKKKREIINN
jgi:UDP-N-acetylmuramyl pentapeptide phosphotransferase/UDP-N-acetylglucosamine-1-phosphate transferase